MAQYWVYLNNDVVGPYAVEQLIRLRGFSRQTLICQDDGSGRPTRWISPAEIPELAPIFKAAEEHLFSPTPPVPAKSPTKSISARPIARPSAPMMQVRPPQKKSKAWLAVVSIALVLGGGAFGWLQLSARRLQVSEKGLAKMLVENHSLPATSLYNSLRHYMQEKAIKPRWEFERVQDGLYGVTLSWSGQDVSTIYAFEANLQVQTLRGLNTAAARLLSEGFPAPLSKTKPAPPAAKKSPLDLFPEALERRRAAVEGGDYTSVWNCFSPRKKAEMARAGMSREGYLRLQNLTFRVDSAMRQTLLKTKRESETHCLALLKQTQTNRPDIFVKQLWVFENEEWALDDEDKHTASEAPSAAKPSAAVLPGMSN